MKWFCFRLMCFIIILDFAILSYVTPLSEKDTFSFLFLPVT